MKKYITIIILAIGLTQSVMGQSDKQKLEGVFEEYFSKVKQKDNEQMLEYIYPKFFDYYSKGKILEAMNQMKDDTSAKVTMDNVLITNIAEIIEIEGVKYTLLKYAFKLKMNFKPSENKESTTDEINPLDLTLEIFKEKYGENNVKYDRKSGNIEVNARNELYAIYDQRYSGWKFLEKKESLAKVIGKIIPKKALKKLG